MNTAQYIAHKLIKKSSILKGYSRPIILMATISIAISIFAMLSSSFIIKGFQETIRNKVSNFNAHLRISDINYNESFESIRFYQFPEFILDSTFQERHHIKHLFPFAKKPIILHGEKEYSGLLAKGIDQKFPPLLFENQLEGRMLSPRPGKVQEVMISAHTANEIEAHIGDTIQGYFPRKSNKPKRVAFEVVGIYQSGLSDFDEQFCFIDIQQIQKINRWGASGYLVAEDFLFKDSLILRAETFGGNGDYRFLWKDGWKQNYHLFPKNKAVDSYLLIGDVNTYYEKDSVEVYDTVYFNFEAFQNLEALDLNQKVSGTSSYAYVGGFEILLDDFENIQKTQENIEQELPYTFNVHSIIDLYPQIFDWLDIIDKNVDILFLLMLTICLISASTTLLVMIMERRKMIAILRSYGTSVMFINKVFIYIMWRIIGRGLLYGNMAALLLWVLQSQFQIIKLPKEVYFMDAMPISFDLLWFVLINLITFALVSLILIIPGRIISKVSPVVLLKE